MVRYLGQRPMTTPTEAERVAMGLSPAQREAVGDGRVTECPYNHPTGTKCPNCARWPFKKGGALGFVTAVRAALSQEDV